LLAQTAHLSNYGARQTPPPHAAAAVTGTYVVCLDCGREFPYDWAQMKTLASAPRNPWAIAPVAVVPGLKAA